MQAVKLPPPQLSAEEQVLLVTEQQLLTDARQWLHRAAELYTHTSKIKIWVPFVCSMVITGYYLYNMHERAAAEALEQPAPAAASARPAVVAEVTPSGDVPPANAASSAVPSSEPAIKAGTSDTDASDADFRKRAEQAHLNQRFDEEAELLQRFADHSATPQLACPAIGAAYEHAGQIDSAAKAFEKCASLEPGNVDTLVGFAHLLQSKRDFKRAAMLYRQALLKDAGCLDAQTGLALIELKQNHLPEADDAVRSILRRAPDNTDALLIAGIVAWRQARLPDAEKIFLKGVGLDDHRADFHAFLGRIEEAERRPQEALSQYERSLVLAPGEAEIVERRDRLRNAR
jgi:tetratricopeptide (TPR) repeat protein